MRQYYSLLARCVNCDKLYPFQSWRNRSMCMECTTKGLQFRQEAEEEATALEA